jgi:hypothetical protein
LQVPGFVVLMRYQPVVSSPLGVPVPLSNAEVVVIDVAAEVVASGAAASARADVPSTSRRTEMRKKAKYMREARNPAAESIPGHVRLEMRFGACEVSKSAGFV